MLCLGGICRVLRSWKLGLFVAERLSSKGSRRCFSRKSAPSSPLRPPKIHRAHAKLLAPSPRLEAHKYLVCALPSRSARFIINSRRLLYSVSASIIHAETHSLSLSRSLIVRSVFVFSILPRYPPLLPIHPTVLRLLFKLGLHPRGFVVAFTGLMYESSI